MNLGGLMRIRRISLAALFLIMTLIGVIAGWYGQRLRHYSARAEARVILQKARFTLLDSTHLFWDSHTKRYPPPPLTSWEEWETSWFGVEHTRKLYYIQQLSSAEPFAVQPEQVAHALRQFPELLKVELWIPKKPEDAFPPSDLAMADAILNGLQDTPHLQSLHLREPFPERLTAAWAQSAPLSNLRDLHTQTFKGTSYATPAALLAILQQTPLLAKLEINQEELDADVAAELKNFPRGSRAAQATPQSLSPLKINAAKLPFNPALGLVPTEFDLTCELPAPAWRQPLDPPRKPAESPAPMKIDFPFVAWVNLRNFPDVALEKCEHLRRISLSVGQDKTALIQDCPVLTEVYVGGNGVLLQRLPKLQKVTASGCGELTIDTCAELQRLDLSFCRRTTFRELPALTILRLRESAAKFDALPQLRSLSIANITPAELDQFRNLPRLERLSVTAIDQRQLPDRNAPYLGFRDFPAVRLLAVDSHFPNNEFPVEVQGRSTLPPRLEWLSVRGASLDQTKLARVAPRVRGYQAGDPQMPSWFAHNDLTLFMGWTYLAGQDDPPGLETMPTHGP
jgi:hypothetical protein